MNRQEPVIDSRFLKCRTLKDRVDLSWETVENLTKQMQTPIPTQAPVQSQPVAEIAPQPFAPAVEAALRENLKNTVEMAAENAVTRIKADLERSVASTIQQAVAAEVQKLDLSDIIKR